MTKAKQTILEQVKHLRTKGYTFDQIADEFNEQGLKTPTGKQWKGWAIAQNFRGKLDTTTVTRTAPKKTTSVGELIRSIGHSTMPVHKKVSILQHLV